MELNSDEGMRMKLINLCFFYKLEDTLHIATLWIKSCLILKELAHGCRDNGNRLVKWRNGWVKILTEKCIFIFEGGGWLLNFWCFMSLYIGLMTLAHRQHGIIHANHTVTGNREQHRKKQSHDIPTQKSFPAAGKEVFLKMQQDGWLVRCLVIGKLDSALHICGN